MSVQACRIRGYGHIVKNGTLPPRFNKIENTSDNEFWDESGISKDYWFFSKAKEDNPNISPIGVCINHMDGDSYFIGVITEASYLECSEPNWDRKKFRDDEYVKKYSDSRILNVFGITEPCKEIEYEIYQ